MSSKPTREPVSRPGEPTDASPGSSRKIRVLMERAARKEALFHPRDNLRRKLPQRQVTPIPVEAAEEVDVDLAG